VSEFDYKRFERDVTALLEVYESGALDRAWGVVCGMIEVVSHVDGEHYDSHEESVRAAWSDFHKLFAEDGKGTYTFFGMYMEMVHAVRERGSELEADIFDIGMKCRRPKKRKRSSAKKRKTAPKAETKTAPETAKPQMRPTKHPHLQVVY